MSEHTELPWIANNNHSNPLALTRIESKNEHGIVNDGCIIAELEGPAHKGNAEFIVRACNAHDDLVEAGSVMLKALDNCPGSFNYDPAVEDNMRKAIAKAKGE